MTLAITLVIISRNSPKRFFSASVCRNAPPSPRIKAATSADMTHISGGISIVKYGAIDTACDVSATYSSAEIIEGKNITPVAYDRNPANNVNT